MDLSLVPHPMTPCRALRAVDATINRRDGGLDVRFCAEGDLERIVWPAPAGRRRVDGLWQHTCFEAFLASGDDRSYCEFNFSPSGEWASYAFTDYRDGMRKAREFAAPVLHQERAQDTYKLSVNQELGIPGLLKEESVWRVAVSAVIEETGGEKSYWALIHPSEKPDFHHKGGFICLLDPPSIQGAHGS